ncbi:citramalate synthase [Luteipulveratus sp. YIM 133132]|uniref:citramalate synthase n=1 Tax=Luteipulveratus flavus TaxID=3031728 RepID=UPI0023AED3F4|nr:citramalate synthase [Luteipulveratus sp. YIM 133132]MDE9366329.1 citramalate synthase [Luteipulveratus sp. YIM 133132]
MSTVHVYDTTLRDGAQQEGLNLSVTDKLAIAAHLDDLGVGFIEGGWPGANPKDTEFFRRAHDELDLRTARLAAFGSTRRAGARAAEDPQVAALLDARTPVVTLVAKSHPRHVELALRTTLAENLAMIEDTVSHLVAAGRTVFLDAEHFFDGYALDPAYALEVVRTAAGAGAEVVVLCDTNGGMLPPQVGQVVQQVARDTGARLGIHCHNDTGCAVANSVAAVQAGATHVQGTINGYGERTGNADLVTVVSNLQLKLGHPLLPPERLARAAALSHQISEITNVVPYSRQPYVGASAFAHKAGLHASALRIDPDLYQHTDPALVGNQMRTLVSDMAGRASIELKGKELGYDLSDRPELLARMVRTVKDLELQGWTFDAADASFELLLRREVTGEPLRYFDVESWRVITDSGSDSSLSEATVKLVAAGERQVAVGEGNGPVNALDHALRQALAVAYPELDKLELIDFRVRILDASHGTDATTRVLVETSDGSSSWETVGVAGNIVHASWLALIDSFTYGLLSQGVEPR